MGRPVIATDHGGAPGNHPPRRETGWLIAPRRSRRAGADASRGAGLDAAAARRAGDAGDGACRGAFHAREDGGRDAERLCGTVAAKAGRAHCRRAGDGGGPAVTVGSILVIKTGALGDFIQALGAMKAIRRHHPDDRITLLTTPPFAGLGQGMRLFRRSSGSIPRPRGLEIGAWLAWRRQLRGAGFARIYDLQNSERTALYSWLLWPQPAGMGRPCPLRVTPQRLGRTHGRPRARRPCADAGQGGGHRCHGRSAGLDNRRRRRLRPAGALRPAHPRLRARPSGEALAGGALWRTRPPGCWRKGLTPVILGTAEEADASAGRSKPPRPAPISLLGRTTLDDIVRLGRAAPPARSATIRGRRISSPPTGCPTLTLFSQRSDPARATPKGARVEVIRQDLLPGLPVQTVVNALQHVIDLPK